MRFKELKNLSRIHAKLGLHHKSPESQYQAPEISPHPQGLPGMREKAAERSPWCNPLALV